MRAYMFAFPHQHYEFIVTSAFCFPFFAAHSVEQVITHFLLMHCNNRSKAARAKRLLRKRETLREEKKAAALAAGVDWKSDNSDDESPVRSLFSVGWNWNSNCAIQSF